MRAAVHLRCISDIAIIALLYLQGYQLMLQSTLDTHLLSRNLGVTLRVIVLTQPDSSEFKVQYWQHIANDVHVPDPPATADCVMSRVFLSS